MPELKKKYGGANQTGQQVGPVVGQQAGVPPAGPEAGQQAGVPPAGQQAGVPPAGQQAGVPPAGQQAGVPPGGNQTGPEAVGALVPVPSVDPEIQKLQEAETATKTDLEKKQTAAKDAQEKVQELSEGGSNAPSEELKVAMAAVDTANKAENDAKINQANATIALQQAILARLEGKELKTQEETEQIEKARAILEKAKADLAEANQKVAQALAAEAAGSSTEVSEGVKAKAKATTLEEQTNEVTKLTEEENAAQAEIDRLNREDLTKKTPEEMAVHEENLKAATEKKTKTSGLLGFAREVLAFVKTDEGKALLKQGIQSQAGQTPGTPASSGLQGKLDELSTAHGRLNTEHETLKADHEALKAKHATLEENFKKLVDASKDKVSKAKDIAEALDTKTEMVVDKYIITKIDGGYQIKLKK